MTKNRAFQYVFVFLLLSLPALASPPLQGSAELSLARAILAEPVTLQACLLAPAIAGNDVLVSSEMLMTLRMVGPHGPCKKALNIQGLEINPGSLWMLPIFLTKESPRWCKQIRLNEEFVLQGAGDYTITIEWLSRPVDAKARTNILSETKLKFPGKALFFEEDFSFSKRISLLIEPPTGLDKTAYEGTNNCPLCDPAKLLKDFPASTYAGYVLLGHGPGGSLLEASVLTPEKRDLEWHVPTGATLAKQEEWRKAARESYETFIKQAKAFLCVHPDFAEQALLRKELATALFNVDKPDEAWIEVEALAKLEGQWADEAKDCLKARASKKRANSLGINTL